jgi:hypothetical protein
MHLERIAYTIFPGILYRKENIWKTRDDTEMDLSYDGVSCRRIGSSSRMCLLMIAEAIVKIIGLRYHYFTVPWNLFDFLLVVASILGILMEDIMIDFPVSPTLLRVVRVFRIGRILRLIKVSFMSTLLCTVPPHHHYSERYRN